MHIHTCIYIDTYNDTFIYIIYAHRIRTVECSDERMLNESMPEHVHHLLRVYLLYCYTLLHLRGVCAFAARCVYLLFSALLHLLYCYTLMHLRGVCAFVVRCVYLLFSALLHLLYCTYFTAILYCTCVGSVRCVYLLYSALLPLCCVLYFALLDHFTAMTPALMHGGTAQPPGGVCY